MSLPQSGGESSESLPSVGFYPPTNYCTYWIVVVEQQLFQLTFSFAVLTIVRVIFVVILRRPVVMNGATRRHGLSLVDVIGKRHRRVVNGWRGKLHAYHCGCVANPKIWKRVPLILFLPNERGICQDEIRYWFSLNCKGRRMNFAEGSWAK